MYFKVSMSKKRYNNSIFCTNNCFFLGNNFFNHGGKYEKSSIKKKC